MARSIHYLSDRAAGPFISINCAAIPEEVFESELFGSEPGAFTGATKRDGFFKEADHGMLFLDEISEISFKAQAKLLRVLQEKAFYRVGGRSLVRVNVRIISATNANVENLVLEKKFRQDLLYRLEGFPLYVPPLRERSGDVRLLTNHFIQRSPKRVAVEDGVYQVLESHTWPGNVRELKNFVHRAILLANANRDVISVSLVEALLKKTKVNGVNDELPAWAIQSIEDARKGNIKGCAEAVQKFESLLCSHALRLANGNKKLAAKWLGISRTTLRTKVK